VAFDASGGRRVLFESGKKRVSFDQVSKRMPFAFRCCFTLLAVTTQTPPVGLGYGFPQIGCPVHGKNLVRVMAFVAREFFGHQPAVDAGPDLVDDPPEMVGFTVTHMAGCAVASLLLFCRGVRESFVSGGVTHSASKRCMY